MRLSTTSLWILAILVRAAIAQEDEVPSIIIIPIIPTIIPLPVEEGPVSTTPVIDPPTATSAPSINPIPDPLPTSSPIELEVSSTIPENTTSPTPPQPVTTSAKEDVKITASTTEIAVPIPESTKTLCSTTVNTEKPTSQPETCEASSTSTSPPSLSVVPFEGGAGSLKFSVQYTAFALMDVLGVFMLA